MVKNVIRRFQLRSDKITQQRRNRSNSTSDIRQFIVLYTKLSAFLLHLRLFRRSFHRSDKNKRKIKCDSATFKTFYTKFFIKSQGSNSDQTKTNTANTDPIQFQTIHPNPPPDPKIHPKHTKIQPIKQINPTNTNSLTSSAVSESPPPLP